MDINYSIDIEDAVRNALSPYFQIYCRPLPENFTTPSLLVTQVGGSDTNKINTFEVTLDSRAKVDGDALELLRKAVGTLKKIAEEQSTPIRYVSVNSSGSWGADPTRPDLAMRSARLQITAHISSTEVLPMVRGKKNK